VSTAEKIFEKAQTLPPPAQTAVLQVVELLAKKSSTSPKPAPKAGSAKGLIEIGPDFDEPLEDFKPYME
jgi:hypothetical protein